MFETDAEKRALAQHVVGVLNDINDLDPILLPGLIAYRTVTNTAVANHPTVQVDTANGRPPTVGILGIINGIVGVDAGSWGYIAADVDPGNNRINRFFVRGGA